MKTTDKTGKVVASFPIEEDSEIMIITQQAKLIRLGVDKIRERVAAPRASRSYAAATTTSSPRPRSSPLRKTRSKSKSEPGVIATV